MPNYTQGTDTLHMPDHGITATQSKTQVGIDANSQTFRVFLHIYFLISGLSPEQ